MNEDFEILREAQRQEQARLQAYIGFIESDAVGTNPLRFASETRRLLDRQTREEIVIYVVSFLFGLTALASLSQFA